MLFHVPECFAARLEDPAKPMMIFDVLAQAVTAHATRAAEKLRQHDLLAGTLTLFFHTNPHKPGADADRKGMA